MAADCLCFRARRVARALTRMYDQALRPLGIQATQLTLLNAVAVSGERGAEAALDLRDRFDTAAAAASSECSARVGP